MFAMKSSGNPTRLLMDSRRFSGKLLRVFLLGRTVIGAQFI
jgi:hypothetical protein